MKRAFLVSIAVFSFVVACGKKDKKMGQAGKTAGQAQTDCSGKKAETDECKKIAAEAAEKAKISANIDSGEDLAASGAETAKDSIETIPNVDDSGLKEQAKMSITLSDKTALIANLRVSADTDDMIATKVKCADINDPNDMKEVVETNPDDLKDIDAHILLFNNSSIAADMTVANGDKTLKPKTYLLTCNSGSTAKASDYADEKGNSKRKEVEVKKLVVGQQTFEIIRKGTSVDAGVLASFECTSDSDVLKSKVKMVGKKAANRIHLRKGSSVMVFRAVDVKEGEKKIKELGGSDAQKEAKYTVVSCS
ncbi:MAG: hypothetical protein B7Y39_16320 [Bdellovibrio sp. 28-41-41]|nr:MAG: hypothetical protein B7Y39_16320 [Bdellovibrio sp. 28-41-41]